MALGLCEAVETRATPLARVWSPCDYHHSPTDWWLALVEDGVYLVNLDLGLLVVGDQPTRHLEILASKDDQY